MSRIVAHHEDLEYGDSGGWTVRGSYGPPVGSRVQIILRNDNVIRIANRLDNYRWDVDGYGIVNFYDVAWWKELPPLPLPENLTAPSEQTGRTEGANEGQTASKEAVDSSTGHTSEREKRLENLLYANVGLLKQYARFLKLHLDHSGLSVTMKEQFKQQMDFIDKRSQLILDELKGEGQLDGMSEVEKVKEDFAHVLRYINNYICLGRSHFYDLPHDMGKAFAKKMFAKIDEMKKKWDINLHDE